MAVLPFSEFSASQNGVLVYGSSALYQVQLAWRNREGTRQASIGTPGIYAEARLSPDEKRLVVTDANPETGTSDLWTLELSKGILSRLTSHASEDAQWSPNSQELVFSSSQKGHLDQSGVPTTTHAENVISRAAWDVRRVPRDRA